MIETSVIIQRDPAVVFAFVADSRHGPRYLPVAESIEKITDGPIRSGTQFRARTRYGTWEVGEIVDYQPNSRLTLRVTTASKPNLDVTTFVPVNGGTLINHRFESELSLSASILGSAFRLPRAKRKLLATRQAGWSKLKQILESGDSARSSA
jgi:uncharacterized protein YndB with AHSA1/START domain